MNNQHLRETDEFLKNKFDVAFVAQTPFFGIGTGVEQRQTSLAQFHHRFQSDANVMRFKSSSVRQIERVRQLEEMVIIHTVILRTSR